MEINTGDYWIMDLDYSDKYFQSSIRENERIKHFSTHTATEMMLGETIDEIYENILKVPANRRRLPLFEKLCDRDPSGYITRDGYFVKDGGRVRKYYADLVIANKLSLYLNNPNIPATAIPVINENRATENALLRQQTERTPYSNLSTESTSDADVVGQSSRQFPGVESLSSLQVNEEYFNTPTRRRAIIEAYEQINSTFNMLPTSINNNPQIGINHSEQGFSASVGRFWSPPKPGRYCTFCKNNKEDPEYYKSHESKDKTGRVTCPVLKSLICEECGATGENAHTISYCPKLKKMTNERPVSTAKALKLTEIKSNGKPRFN